jgi:hypothetical protein
MALFWMKMKAVVDMSLQKDEGKARLQAFPSMNAISRLSVCIRLYHRSDRRDPF